MVAMASIISCVIALCACIIGGIYSWKFYKLINYKPLILLPIAFFYAIPLRFLQLLFALDITHWLQATTPSIFTGFWIMLVMGIVFIYEAVKKQLGGKNG